MSTTVMKNMKKTGPQCFQSLIEVFMYIDGQLDPERAGELDEHLKVCKECFERYEFESFLKGHLKRKNSIDMPSTDMVDSITQLLYQD